MSEEEFESFHRAVQQMIAFEMNNHADMIDVLIELDDLSEAKELLNKFTKRGLK